MTVTLAHAGSTTLQVLIDGDVVMTYVFDGPEPVLESPRPYAMLATRTGRGVCGYRPADHVWHRGLSLALPNVGEHNFWGGPTYLRDQGYVQLPNNGSQLHRGFLDEREGGFGERLDWLSQDGDLVLSEVRRLTVHPVDASTWALTWRSVLTNRTTEPLAFGSPTSRGRDNAGYGGIFWRGPEQFTGGQIIAPDGPVGDAARGGHHPWLAFTAEEAGVLIHRTGPWFARSEEFAGLCPAPFFYDETTLDPGGNLTLTAAVVVGDGDVASHSQVAATLAG